MTETFQSAYQALGGALGISTVEIIATQFAVVPPTDVRLPQHPASVRLRDQPIRVVLQQKSSPHQPLRRRAHRAYVFLVRAVAFLQRQPRIARGLSLRFGFRERNEAPRLRSDAPPVKSFGDCVPSRVSSQRRLMQHARHTRDFVAVRVHLRNHRRKRLADRRRLAQLLSNLLANALVHGDSAAPVRVRARTGPDGLELSVANAGPPIPEAARLRLFQPFVRAGAHVHGEGLGLGLYIAAEIARGHGGTLDVASDASETCFTLRLPAAAVVQPRAAEAAV